VQYTDARCLGVSRQKQLAECTPLTRIEKQRALNGDKTPDTEQWKFAQRHPLLLSDVCGEVNILSTFCLNPSAGLNEFAGRVQTNSATHLFLSAGS